jgi:hypothetical protein
LVDRAAAQRGFQRNNRADALLLLRQHTAGSTTPARMLLIAIATQTPTGYQLLAANAPLVPTDPSGRLEDPMADGEIVVRRGGFDLKIGMMPTTGSYLAATMQYRFRLGGRCVRLIGFDRNETHRATLDTRDVSVNFLTRAVVQTTGNAQSGATQTRRTRLAANPRRLDVRSSCPGVAVTRNAAPRDSPEVAVRSSVKPT